MLDDILPHLQQVKQRGDRWWACCPVHDDNSPSMTLREDGERVLIHCFSCQANGIQVAEALGLPASVLFLKEKARPPIPRKVLELAKEDRFFIAIFESEIESGNRVTFNDKKRYRLALERVKLLDRRG